MDDRTTISVTEDTLMYVRSYKRGGESYDDLLQKMVNQYEPEEVTH